MKLAEALTKIKDLKGKAAELQRVILSENTFQMIDVEQVVPNIETELLAFTEVITQLRELKTQVETANIENGLTTKIHEMEQLRYAIKALEQLSRVKQESKSLQRLDYTSPPTMITTVATFNVSNLQSQLDIMRTRVRELDLELQRLNWQVNV